MFGDNFQLYGRLQVAIYMCPIITTFINPRHMHKGYGSHSVCVCYHADCYISYFFHRNLGVIRLSVLFLTYALCGFH